MTGYPTQANQDLRVLAKCIHSDACRSNYEYFPKGFPEHRKAEVSALAADMEAAFRAGDPRPLFWQEALMAKERWSVRPRFSAACTP